MFKRIQSHPFLLVGQREQAEPRQQELFCPSHAADPLPHPSIMEHVQCGHSTKHPESHVFVLGLWQMKVLVTLSDPVNDHKCTSRRKRHGYLSAISTVTCISKCL